MSLFKITLWFLDKPSSSVMVSFTFLPVVESFSGEIEFRVFGSMGYDDKCPLSEVMERVGNT